MKKRITVDFSGVHSASTIEEKLRRNPLAFVKHLYGNTRIQTFGEEVRVGNKGSTALYLSDFHWYDYESCESGLGLIDFARAAWGVNFKEALARCAVFLKEHKITDAYIPARVKTHEQQEYAKQRNKRRALHIIDNANSIVGTVAERYLRNRKIDTSVLPISALHQLGYVASCYHRQADTKFPALIATVRDHTHQRIAVHRIYLTDQATKADIPSNKSSLGSTKGASVHLTRARDTLILTEGVEDGLSVLLGIKDDKKYGVWCGIGGNLPSIIIPKDIVRCVVLAVDNDPSGHAYIQKLAPRLTQEGFCVCVAIPNHGKDFNEMWCRYGRLFNPNLMEKYND